MKSKYRGVTWHPHGKQWQVVLRVDGKLIHFGYFRDDIKAARLADFIRYLLHGPAVSQWSVPVGKPNFPLCTNIPISRIDVIRKLLDARALSPERMRSCLSRLEAAGELTGS